MPDSKELSLALKKIQSKYGEGSIGLLGSMKAIEVEAISTGIPDLDYAIGVAGAPRGRIIEIYGPEGSGKTTVALKMIAAAQKLGHTAAFIDVEHSLDPERAAILGVDLKSLIFSQPDTAEEALGMCIDLASTGVVSLIILDSVAGLLPQDEEDKEMDQNTIGLQARLMSKFCRKAKGILNTNKCTLVAINQIREKVGVMFGNPETTPGGRALRFFSSVRMEVRKIDTLGTKEAPIGQKVRIKIVKNKVSAPFKTAEFDLYSDARGVDVSRGLINKCTDLGIMQKSGSWIYYPDKDNIQELFGVSCRWQSATKCSDDFYNNKELSDFFYNKFIDYINMQNSRVEEDDEIPSDDEIVKAVQEEFVEVAHE